MNDAHSSAGHTKVERMLPLYEGKMGAQYDHRAASFTGIGNTDIVRNESRLFDDIVLPRYWVRESVVEDKLALRSWGSENGLLAFRRVARNTDERTVISSFIPYGGASNGWILTSGPSATHLTLLIAQYNSFVFDFVLRQFLSQPSIPQGTFEQLPCLPIHTFRTLDCILGDATSWVVGRATELGANGSELARLADELGYEPQPWNPERRALLRAELDAAMFHLYGIARDDVDYIMETFPIVKRHDESEYGEYRTKRLILEIYDAMAEAMRTGAPYASQA